MTPNEFQGRMIAAQKRIEKKKRCLHYDAGEICNQYIGAHSIQNNGQLSAISEDGHVYMLDEYYTDLVKNQGKLGFSTVGVKKASTFYGFCGKHDNELFKPIEENPLKPSDEQIALHLYRCVCKETYEKENSLELANEILRFPVLEQEILTSYKLFAHGTQLGLDRIRYHKGIIEQDLKKNDFSKFSAITFFMNGEQFMCFSGITMPTHDYYGIELQDLSEDAPLDQLAVFTAPSTAGWTISFAWHDDHCQSNLKLINSMKSLYKDGTSFSTLISRLLFTCMENYALKISWFDSKPKILKDEITETFTKVMSPFEPIQTDVLRKGFEDSNFFDVINVSETNLKKHYRKPSIMDRLRSFFA